MKSQIEEKLKVWREEINDRLGNLSFPEVPRSLYNPMKYTLSARGKRIRPILLFLVGEGLGVDHEQLIPTALSVEILHTFTLVHDDIMDNDTHRRGMPTVHVKWDVNTAILLGDALMSIAFKTLMQTDSPNVPQMGSEFSKAMLEICEGQSLDMEFEGRDNVDSGEYLEMVGKKTGRLLGLSCQLGAMVADSDQKVVDEMFLFGKELGKAFQIQDDLLEITSDEQKMGKSLGSDIFAGKKTYPMIEAISGMTDEEKGNFISFLRKNANNRETILKEFKKRGCIEKSRNLINTLLDQAKSCLKVLPQKAQNDLESLVEIISYRQS